MGLAPIRPSLGRWEIALLGLALGVAALYLVIGTRVPEIVDNDGAYYYGVARHIALTGRFEEPIVWHFVRPPATIVHAPFDYWGCLTSLVLLPALRVFGARPETAFVTMSALSALSVIGFWYLVCVAWPLRHRATQALALAFFAFTPAMIRYRFQPESIAVAELLLVAALVALCRRRLLLVVLCGFGIFLARGDGVVLFGLLSLAALLEARHAGRSVWPLVSTGGACVATYVLWCVFAFGTLTPPGPQAVPFRPTYDVYDFGATSSWSWWQLVGWQGWDHVRERVHLWFSALRDVQFTPVGDLWLVLGVVPALGARRGVEKLVPLLAFGGYVLVSWLTGPPFNPWRTPYTFTPLIILAGALGLDTLLDRIGPRAGTGWFVRVGTAAAVGAVVVWSGFAFFAGLRAVRASKRPVGAELARLDDVLHGEPVASNAPWYVIAYTRSPAVSIPDNGEAAIGAVLERYRVRWLVIFPDALSRLGPESARVVVPLLAGSRTQVDGATLTRVPAAARQIVFRVEPAPRRESQTGITRLASGVTPWRQDQRP